jgi:hypothetical protein
MKKWRSPRVQEIALKVVKLPEKKRGDSIQAKPAKQTN